MVLMSSISKSAFRTFLDMRFRASSSLYFAEFTRPQRSGPLTLTEDARTARAPRSSSPRPQWAVERRLALLTSLLLLPGVTCSPPQGWPCLQGSPLLTLAGVALLPKEKPTARAPAYSAESALLLAARAVPSAPPLSTTAVAAVLKKRSHASILSFCTSFSQLSRYGLATPSSHDGCCAGAPICRQPVLRTLCFTNRWNHHLSSVFIYLTNSPFGLHVYHLHWVSSLGR